MATATARAVKELRAEQRRSAVAAALCWAGVVVLAVVAVLAKAGVVDPTRDPHGDQVWPTSLVALATLLLLAELIALALATEHRLLLSSVDEPLESTWLVVLRVGMLVVTVGLAVWAAEWDPGLRGAAVSAVVLAVVGAVLLVLTLRIDRYGGAPEPTSEMTLPEPPAPPDLGPATGPASRRIRTIAASGGGIRAASFALGGHEAVQAKAKALDMKDPAAEPALYAVSGGSYIAAALAMRRSFDPTTGDPFPTPVPWTKAYRPGSAELDRLRRHTRYLFEPRSQTRDGVITLVAGAVVNLLLAAIAVIVVVWVAVQLVSMLGLTEISTLNEKGEVVVTDFAVAAGLDNWKTWGLVPLVGVGVAAVLTLLGWRGAAWFDEDARTDTPSERGARLLGWSMMGRPLALGVALGWLVLVLGLPAAATGVAEAATQNQPTATIARALTTMGLATPEMCTSAFREDAREKLHMLKAAARTGVEGTAKAGACGAEIELTSKDEIGTTADYEALEQFAGVGRGTRLASLGALLLAVLGLLRWASMTLTVVEGSWLARWRARLLVWVPLLVTGGVAIYLALVAAQRMLVSGAQLAANVTWIALAAGVVCYFLNANMTTMHNFYRGRLSDAFAISVSGGRARPLPYQRVYRFSDLVGRPVAAVRRLRVALEDVARGSRRDDASAAAAITAVDEVTEKYMASGEAPEGAESFEDAEVKVTEESARTPVRLHIVATLNTQAPNESPTMRGGFPMVFGPDKVQVFRGQGDTAEPPTRRYEDFAGPGRVSIMAAVAVSGAAVSPLMGRNAQRVTPFRFLLALFNVRLGTWVLNPAHTPEPGSTVGLSRDRLGALPVLWMTSRPGAGQMLKEAAGSSSADGRWVYVSDGGHLDNTGLVEAVRAASATGGRVLGLDASNDAPGSWSAVGDAISVIRADLDLDLVRDLERPLPPWARLFRLGADSAAKKPPVEVLVVKAVRVDEPTDDAPDPEWWRLLPSDVQAFQKLHADFPRASTTRQKFGDLEFEAYRQLGYLTTSIALDRAGWLGPTTVAQAGLSSRATP